MGMKKVYGNFDDQESSLVEQYRDQQDLIISPLDLLAEKDRVIMSPYLLNGANFRNISVLTGQHKATICRRARRIMQALVSGPYIKVLQRQDLFSNTELAVIRDFYLRGSVYREMAGQYGISMHLIRKVVDRARVIAGPRAIRLTANETGVTVS
jgi:uncharacterized protein YerC